MVVQKSADTFTGFVRQSERRLRQSLMGAFGGELGRDAAAQALEYAWVNWDRIKGMENPVGYLYKVGRTHAHRELRRRRPVLGAVDTETIPEVEPKLAEALAGLSERQRAVVVLVHGYGWTQVEVSEVLGLSRSSVRNHLERGMTALRRTIGRVL